MLLENGPLKVVDDDIKLTSGRQAHPDPFWIVNSQRLSLCKRISLEVGHSNEGKRCGGRTCSLQKVSPCARSSPIVVFIARPSLP